MGGLWELFPLVPGFLTFSLTASLTQVEAALGNGAGVIRHPHASSDSHIPDPCGHSELKAGVLGTDGDSKRELYSLGCRMRPP